MKKRAILVVMIALSLIILSALSEVSAISLEVSERPISNAFIIELDKPAIYELSIKNNNETDVFQIYSVVGIDIFPESFEIENQETTNIEIQLMPQESLKSPRNAPLTFEYKIKNSKNEIQKETLSINIVNLESSFNIKSESINPHSNELILTIKNNLIHKFTNLKIRASSAFFDSEQTISFEPLQEKEIKIQVDKEKLKTINAGSYLMNFRITIDGISADIKSQIQFSKEEGVESSESKEGTIIIREEMTRKNIGNVKKTVKITTKKNLFSSIFTFTNLPPTKTKIQGLTKTYTWENELIPNEELKIIIKTNLAIPLIILIIIITSIILIRKSKYSNLLITKKVSFVKTKGGQFALKITLKVKAKSFVERIRIHDKLPHLVKLYEKFGEIKPDKVDLQNRRLEWNIESINKDESRLFTYIIYSKIGVVGRFELPNAHATYEKDGKIKEAFSNRSFYINEPRE